MVWMKKKGESWISSLKRVLQSDPLYQGEPPYEGEVEEGMESRGKEWDGEGKSKERGWKGRKGEGGWVGGS